jgi:hypothetical protein
MSRHRTVTSLARRVRPTSAGFAGAAALRDPSPLLALQAAQRRERALRPAPPRRRGGGRSSIRRALAGESGGAVALVAAIALALLWPNSPYPGWIHPAAMILAAGLLALLLSIRAIAARQFRARGDSPAALTPLSMLIGRLTNAYEPRPQGPAATSPVTWGIVLAYLVGKPLGIVIASRAAYGRAVPSLSRGELRGTALSAGVGFTVSLLIASRAFDGALLDQAKVGILATALLAPALASAALAPLRMPLTSACPA